jgi:hypothetical protein
MSILEQLASMQDRQDEILNQELAARICASTQAEDVYESIQELVDNLKNPQKPIRHDCIKVLYEIGAIKPALIENYVDEFLALLKSKDNRMVWGAMTALGAIARQQAKAIWAQVDLLMETCKSGSVISQDWGIRILAELASIEAIYAQRIFPFLLSFLKDCPAKDLPRHAESSLIAIRNKADSQELRNLLEERLPELNANQGKRIQQLLKRLS